MTWRPFGGAAEAAPVVVVDDEGVRRRLSDGRVEAVRWEELVGVACLTTADGPFSEDLFFVLVGEGGTGCVVPSELAQGTDLVGRLTALPGFDHEAFIRACQTTHEETFPCWRRQD